MMQKLFAFLGVISLTFAVNTYRKVVVNDPDALCLDGTQGAYYIY